MENESPATEPQKARRSRGEGSLIKLAGCRYWYAQYYGSDGRKIRVSTKTEVKQVAIRFLRDRLTERDKGMTPISDSRKLKYRDLRDGIIANYIEKGNRSLSVTKNGEETITGLRQLDLFFGFSAQNPGPRLVQITTDTGRAFVAKRQAEGVGAAVINRSLACLRRMLRIAHEDGKIQHVPVIRLLKEPPARKGFLPLENFDALLQQLPPTLKPLVAFLYYGGVRIGEALQIEWSQVDLNARLIRLEEEQTKTGKARVVPLPVVLADMLQEIEPKVGRVFNDTNLRKEWHRACAACGLGRIIEVEGKPYDPRYEGLTIHDLRRSAVRNLVTIAGVPERIAMKISGHKTRNVFDRYHIVSTEDVSNAMQRLELAAQNLLPQPNGAKLGKKQVSKSRKPLMALSSRG